MKLERTISLVFCAAAGVAIATPQVAHAEAAEFFKCTLREGATLDQAVAVASDYLKESKKNGRSGYSIRFLSPIYSSDTGNGVFYWVGTGPTLGSVAGENDYWPSDANKAIRERFGALITGCQSASLYTLTPVPAAK